MAVTIQQIAEAAGVSRGTVDRVLHRRGKVRPEVEQNICKIAEEMGYFEKKKRSVSCRSAKEFCLGIVVTTIETPTMKLVLEGAQAAQEKLCAMGATVHIRALEQLDPQEQIACIRELEALGINALAIAPSSDQSVCACLAGLAEKGIPIVTMNGDLPECKRLCYVGMDNERGGRIAAGFMHLLLPEGGKVLPITAHLTHHAHKQRYTAFGQEIQNYPDIQLLSLQSCFNRDDFAYEIILHAVEENPDLKGVYVAANGTRGVCEAISYLGLTDRLHVVAFDLNEENKADLARGRIDVVLEQDPFAQGYRPPFLLFEHVTGQKRITQEFAYTDIGIKIKQML
ncbi:MAG: LacI family DNA-binding transcriptional regulator [Eubacteriales bacterium]|nr:LacI family DNA-binding transcriptional regulator [Eubacteriales bacterium]